MFKGLGNLGNLASMVGSLQQLPARMQELNENLQQETVSATSSCSRVLVVMNGVGHVESIRLSPDLSGAELEQAIKEATNAAAAAAKQLYAESISQMASDMNLNMPGMEGMLATLTGSK